MKCADCPYYWADFDENGNYTEDPHCRYPYDDCYAPCEVDDYEEEDESYGE